MAIRHIGFILIVTLLIALSATEPALAGVEISPSINYRFGGGFEDTHTDTNIHLDESAGYGLVLDFDIQPDSQVEVYLSRQSTTMSSGGPFTDNPLFDVSVNYYHIGGLYLFDGERFRPFISGTLGLTRMDPQRADLRSETRMSLALGGGAKLFFTESLGIRLDVRGIYTAINLRHLDLLRRWLRSPGAQQRFFSRGTRGRIDSALPVKGLTRCAGDYKLDF